MEHIETFPLTFSTSFPKNLDQIHPLGLVSTESLLYTQGIVLKCNQGSASQEKRHSWGGDLAGHFFYCIHTMHAHNMHMQNLLLQIGCFFKERADTKVQLQRGKTKSISKLTKIFCFERDLLTKQS